MMAPFRLPGLFYSFRFRLFSIFTLFTFLVTTLLCILYVISEARATRHEIAQRLQLQAQHLAESIRLPLYAENLDTLRQLSEQAARSPEIHQVIISAREGRVLTRVQSPAVSSPAGLISQTVEVLSSQLVDSVESSLTGGRDTSTSIIGSVRLERRTDDLSRSIRRMIAYSVGFAVIFWLSVTLLCYLILRRLTRSFDTLVHGIETMKNGDFSSRIEIEADDEPGRAARAVNNLAEALRQRGEENIRLQEERLDLERQMFNVQKLESLGVMAGGIAHDFNNLLQSILGNMELASMELDQDSKLRKLIANAMKAGKQAAHLTDLMLTYVGNGFIVRKPLDLNELVRENTEIFKMAASAAVTMKLRLSSESPVIMAGEAQMQQMSMNLITNAAESIEGHPGIIRLTTGIQECDQACLAASLLNEKPPPGRYAFLEVSDNGCGMNNETLRRLFDPFFSTKFTGRGLGMAAVMGIMRTHNGALFVESEPGKGTTFRALFPVSETALPARERPGLPPKLHIERGATKTGPRKSTLPEKKPSGLALVVDDEKSVLKICSKMVELCGFSVITACDGIEALSRFREQADEIDVILMDLTMPNMDGIAAMQEIYGIRPDARVILSSGFKKEELSERITGQTPSGFIRKPYSMNVLEAEIRRVVQPD